MNHHDDDHVGDYAPWWIYPIGGLLIGIGAAMLMIFCVVATAALNN